MTGEGRPPIASNELPARAVAAEGERPASGVLNAVVGDIAGAVSDLSTPDLLAVIDRLRRILGFLEREVIDRRRGDC